MNGEMTVESTNYAIELLNKDIADRLKQETARWEHSYNRQSSFLDDVAQLCIDMYGCATGCTYPQNQRDNFEAKYHDRMADLGLLEGEQ